MLCRFLCQEDYGNRQDGREQSPGGKLERPDLELLKSGWRLRRDGAWDKQDLIWGAHLKWN